MARAIPRLGLLAALPVVSTTAQALPMSYAGSTTAGMTVDSHWSSAWVTRAMDPRHGLGASLQVIPGTGGGHGETSSPASHRNQGDESFLLLDGTHLLKRWNRPSSQANLWLFTGVGLYRASGSASDQTSGGHHHNHDLTGAQAITTPAALRIAARPGLQVDMESTRLRVEGRGEWFVAPGVQRPLLSATAGAALSGPTYTGIQPWLELQVRAMPGVVNTLELIPKLRLLHQRVVLEIGYSSLGSAMGGLTYTF